MIDHQNDADLGRGGKQTNFKGKSVLGIMLMTYSSSACREVRSWLMITARPVQSEGRSGADQMRIKAALLVQLPGSFLLVVGVEGPMQSNNEDLHCSHMMEETGDRLGSRSTGCRVLQRNGSGGVVRLASSRTRFGRTLTAFCPGQ